MDIVELIIDDNFEHLSVDAVSLVAEPAIDSFWIYFSKDNKSKSNLSLAKLDEHKRLIVGAALIPNKQIYRRDENGREFYVYFSESTVKRASECFLKHNNQSSATYEHKDKIDGITAVESWIVEDTNNDKSNIYNLNLPKGSWVLSMKIDNDKIWRDILDKKVKGFSIEGFYIDRLAKLSKRVENKNTPSNDEILTILSDILKLSTYKNYPSQAVLNAQKALIQNGISKLNVNNMSLNIGKKLISRSSLSLTDVKKINSFLVNAKSIDTGKCSDYGSCTYNLYGGNAMLKWSDKILQKLLKL